MANFARYSGRLLSSFYSRVYFFSESKSFAVTTIIVNTRFKLLHKQLWNCDILACQRTRGGSGDRLASLAAPHKQKVCMRECVRIALSFLSLRRRSSWLRASFRLQLEQQSMDMLQSPAPALSCGDEFRTGESRRVVAETCSATALQHRTKDSPCSDSAC